MSTTPRKNISASSGRLGSAAAATSVLSAFIASACCVGPLLLAFLGLGGAGFLVKFEPYRPYFLGATAVFLGAGFWLSYRKPKPSAECEVCEVPRVQKAGRAMLWIAAVLTVAFAAFPYLVPLLFHSGASTQATEAAQGTEIAKATLEIEGMTCASCAIAVEAGLAKVDGFKAVAVAVEQGRAEVSYDPSRTTPEALAAAVTTLGYASKPIASKEL